MVSLEDVGEDISMSSRKARVILGRLFVFCIEWLRAPGENEVLFGHLWEFLQNKAREATRIGGSENVSVCTLLLVLAAAEDQAMLKWGSLDNG